MTSEQPDAFSTGELRLVASSDESQRVCSTSFFFLRFFERGFDEFPLAFDFRHELLLAG